MNRVRRFVTGHDREAGLSLAELLVAITIFGMMMVIVSGVFISFTKATSSAKTMDANVRQVSNGMNELTRIIRAGTNNPVQNSSTPDPAFVAAGRESLTINAFVNFTDTTERPVQVTFSIDSSRRLVEKTQQATSAGNGYWLFNGTISSRIIATAVASQSGSDPYLFTYIDGTGAAMVPDSTGALTLAQRNTIASVQVSLKVKASATSPDSGVTLQNTVGIPNLNSGVVS